MKRIVPFALLLGSCQFIPGTEAAKIKQAETAVKYQLADADSAKFRNVRIDAGGYVCGEVNAKNKFAAYIGFTPFAFDLAKAGAQIFNNEPISREDRNEVLRFPVTCLPPSPPAPKETKADIENESAMANALDAKAANVSDLLNRSP